MGHCTSLVTVILWLLSFVLIYFGDHQSTFIPQKRNVSENLTFAISLCYLAYSPLCSMHFWANYKLQCICVTGLWFVSQCYFSSFSSTPAPSLYDSFPFCLDELISVWSGFGFFLLLFRRINLCMKWILETLFVVVLEHQPSFSLLK